VIISLSANRSSLRHTLNLCIICGIDPNWWVVTIPPPDAEPQKRNRRVHQKACFGSKHASRQPSWPGEAGIEQAQARALIGDVRRSAMSRPRFSAADKTAAAESGNTPLWPWMEMTGTVGSAGIGSQVLLLRSMSES
jgi:hypothetical protein